MFGNTTNTFGNQPASGGLFGNTGNAGGNSFNSGGAGLFGNTQPQQNAPGMVGAAQPANNNIFGVNNNQPAFGGQQNTPFGGSAMPTNTGTIFGGNNAMKATPAFGQANNNIFGNTSTGTAFGNNTPATGGGGIFGGATGNATNTNAGGSVFGGNNNNNNMNTPFKTNAPSTPTFGATNNTSIFGNTGATQNNNSIFGGGNNNTAVNNNTNAGGFFGNTNNTNNAFGGNNAFGNNNANQPFGATTGSVFGGANNNAGGGGLFGSTPANNTATTGIFGATNNAGGGGGLFGNTGNTNSVFGGGNTQPSPFGTNNNNNTSGFFGTGNPTQPGTSVFGGGAATNNTSVFGGANTGNNNAFGAGNNAFGGNAGGNNSVFGGGFGGNTNTNNTNTSNSLFGNTGTNNNMGVSFGGNNANTGMFGNNTNTNTFGNTAWGVPTNTNAFQAQSAAKFTPLKPKNTKIDGKHMVKCITLLDQNMNFCKNELRIRFIMTGGQVPIQQPQQPSFGFGQTSPQQTGFNTGGNLFGGNTNANIAATSGNNGGFNFGNNNNNSAFGNNAFSNNNTQPVVGGGVFGASTSTAGGGLFGGATANNNNNNSAFRTGFNTNTNTNTGLGGGLFGATNNNNNTAIKGGSLFGGVGVPVGSTAPGNTGLFGGATNTNTGGFSLGGGLGAGQTAQTGGLFGGNTATGGGGLFGVNTASTPSTGGAFGGNLFGNTGGQPQATTGLGFGGLNNAQPKGGLFGQTAQPNQGGSLFGGLTAPASTSMFGNNSAAPQLGFGTQPQAGAFGQPGFGQTGGLFGQSQPQATPQFGFGTTPQPGLNQQNPVDFTTALFNGLFNSEFFKKMFIVQNTPFDTLKTQARKKPAIDYSSLEYADSRSQSGSDDYYSGYIPRYNKYNKAMYNSGMNFNHSPYLYTDTSVDDAEYRRLNQEFKTRFSNKNQKFDMREVRPSRFLRKSPEVNIDHSKEQILPSNFTASVVASAKGKTNSSNVTPSRPHSQLRKNTVQEADLPVVPNDYTIYPSLSELRNKSAEQLRKISGVSLENEFGKILFKGPINLFRKNIQDCITISPNAIDIKDKEWDQIKCQLFFYNFGGYADLDEIERQKMERKIKKWVSKNGMSEKNFDKNTGQLHVEVY